MLHIKIQEVQTSEVKTLQSLSKTTFSESFASFNSIENLKTYFKSAFGIKQLLKEMNNPFSRYYFVYFDDVICGYFKINIGEGQTEIKSTEGLELERIYILAKHQGKKIGEKVLEEVKTIAQAVQKKYIWLGVWEQNIKAIKFYERFGFKKFDTHIYPIGDDPQIDWMMKLML